MNKIWTIIKKELKRFFTDKRMLLSLILPGVLIFVIYSFMGSFIEDAFTADNEHTYTVYQENMPDEYKTLLENNEYKVNYYEEKLSFDDVKNKISENEIDLYISFEGFDNFGGEEKPNVIIYYNSSSNESNEIYSYYYSVLLTAGTEVTYYYFVLPNDVATNENISAKVITMLLPYLLLIFLFTGCVSISTESIAGEKERGTISTLLVTPTKRSYIAIGKIIALSLTSLVSASVSFLGLLGSLPKLLGGSDSEITLSMYNFSTYLQLFLVILVVVIFFTTILSIVSTFAKNVKEASQWSSLLMFLVMLLGVSSLVGMGNIATNPIVYMVPVYNVVQCMGGIFSLTLSATNFIITIVSTIVYIAIGVYVLAKMFNSEKIMSSN